MKSVATHFAALYIGAGLFGGLLMHRATVKERVNHERSHDEGAATASRKPDPAS